MLYLELRGEVAVSVVLCSGVDVPRMDGLMGRSPTIGVRGIVIFFHIF